MNISSDFQRYFGKLSIGLVLLDGANNIWERNGEFQEYLDSEEYVDATFIGFLAE